MVEFALVLFPLCLILFAIVEFGMAFWTYQQVSAAASEGARRASISRTFTTTRNERVTEAVKAASPMLDGEQMNVTVSSTWTPGDEVKVTVTYPEVITIMGIPFFNANLTGERTMRVEQ